MTLQGPAKEPQYRVEDGSPLSVDAQSQICSQICEQLLRLFSRHSLNSPAALWGSRNRDLLRDVLSPRSAGTPPETAVLREDESETDTRVAVYTVSQQEAKCVFLS